VQIHLASTSYPDDPTGAAPNPQASTTAVRDEETVQIPPPIISSKSGSGDIGMHFTSIVKSERTHSTSPSNLDDPIGVSNPQLQVPTPGTIIQDDVSSRRILPLKTLSESGSGDVLVHFTPEHPQTTDESVSLATLCIWLVLPILPVPLGIKLTWLALSILMGFLAIRILKHTPAPS
jgi:hypothetical protein